MWLKLLALIAILDGFLVFASPPSNHDWPEFRGPTGQGHAVAPNLPTSWNESENVTWKVSIPGEGWSSPVVLGNQIWMTTATEKGNSLRAICVDRADGKLVHNIELFRPEALEPKNDLNSFASPSPVLESGRAYFSFGNYGNACVKNESGEVLWRTLELKLSHDEGPGSSPILFEDLFILNCDGSDVRYVAALEKSTGKLAWKSDRKVVINKAPGLKKAFCTPLVIRVEDRPQMVSPGASRVVSYDPRTGEEIWWADIPGFSNVPRPIFGHGLVYVCTGYFNPEIWAINPSGKGDVGETHVVWKYKKQVSLKPSPLLVGDHIFMVSDGGIATCLEAKTGKELWQERIGGEYSASPVHANGTIYFFSQQGKTTIVRAKPVFEIVATNTLDEGFMTSPAVAGDALFLRTRSHLYKIEKK